MHLLLLVQSRLICLATGFLASVFSSFWHPLLFHVLLARFLFCVMRGGEPGSAVVIAGNICFLA